MKVVVIASLAESLLNFRGPLLAAMRASGHHVTALAPGENESVAARLGVMGVDYRPLALERTGMNPLRDLRALSQLVACLRELQPDVVFGYTIKPVIYGSLAARLAGVPRSYSMVTGLGYAFIGKGLRQRLVAMLVSALYRAGLSGNAGVFFQNPDDLELFCSRRLLGDPRKAILVNGSGIDLDRYATCEPVPGRPRFLLIARLLRDKGITEYVEAAGILKTRYPESSFRLLGPFDSNPAAITREEIDLWQREGNIEYLGETDDVRPYIADCSVYVLPSYREGTPRTVLEAMAMGRPVVTTDAPGCRETVREGENGFLVQVRDSISLARAMERFILEPGLCVTMGQRSRQVAVEKYDVHKVNEVMLKAMGLAGEKSL